MVTRSPWLPPLACALTVLAVLARPAPARAAPSPRETELLSRIDSRLREPGVAADLYQLADLSLDVEDLEPVAKKLAMVAASSKATRDVRSLAAWILAGVEQQRGRVPRMNERLESLGVVRALAFVGPFDDENHGGYDVARGPEVEPDTAATYDGLRAKVSWRTAPDLGTTGTFHLYEGVRPSRDALVYAATVLNVRRDVKAVIHLGTSGATKAWLSGKPILADPSYHPARFDQGEIPVQLHRGDNVLVLKVAAGQEEPLALILRVVGQNGEPIEGLTAHAAEGKLGKLQSVPAGKKLLAGDPLVQDLTRLARGRGVGAMVDLARVLGERRGFDDQQKKDQLAATDAAGAGPDDVEAQLLAARFATDDSNKRRAFLEQAVKVEKPDQVRAPVALAAFWLERGEARRALDILDPALARAPSDVDLRLLRARALDALGLPAEAEKLVLDLARDNRQVRVLLEEARWLRRDGRLGECERALRVLLAMHPADVQASSLLASILTEKGNLEDALRVHEGQDRLDPGNLAGLLTRADLLAANGRFEEARKLYTRAAALSPQESDVFERSAKASLLAGDHPSAIASLQKALALRPQEPRLKELLGSLRPETTAFARPYLQDVREVAKAKGNWDGEDAVTLLDLTAIKVAPSGQASRTTEVVVRTLTQRGVDAASSYPIRYAPDREDVKVERARILRADGTIVDSHGESDRSLTDSWSGMWFDARVLSVTFPGLKPGDTVELVYRVDDVARDNLLSDYFGDVDFVQDQYPRARWEYVLDMPQGRPLYAHDPPGAKHEKTELADGTTLHHWFQTNVPKVVAEPNMPGWAAVASYLHVSTYKDWESVARFWWGLVKEQVAPTPEIEKAAREIVKDIPESDVASRVRVVYDYVVKHTHYVGLEFGIHSYKPYKVDKILARGFGDCKDKASLAYSLLKAIGIDSRLVLLRMRNLGALAEEPASLSVFNHAILYVPSLDLFLDGTAEYSGSGELPEADRGAEALVVNPDGPSRFEVTPEAAAEAAVTSSTYRITLSADGSARLGGDSEIAGIPAAGYRRAYASPNGRRSSFEQAWAHTFPGLTVARLDVSDLTSLEEPVKLDFGLEVPHFADSVSGGGLSFSPFGSTTRYVETYAPLSARRWDLVMGHPWVNRFRYEVTLPAGATAAQLPPPVNQTTPFGSIQLDFVQEGGKVIAEGEVRLSVARVSPTDYPAFRTFLGLIDRAMAARVEVAPTQARR